MLLRIYYNKLLFFTKNLTSLTPLFILLNVMFMGVRVIVLHYSKVTAHGQFRLLPSHAGTFACVYRNSSAGSDIIVKMECSVARDGISVIGKQQCVTRP